MSRPIYTDGQIQEIYERIQLPNKWRLDPKEAKEITCSEPGLEFLTVLVRFTLANIPFENLELHYSRTKVIDIDPEVLFSKIVTQGTGRGGYCMENNAFFATLLRSLGFELMSTGGRVNSAAAPNGEVGERAMYYGIGHMVNIVTITNTRYLVDVGFGAGCATRPLPLEDGKVHLNLKPNQYMRLRYDTIPEYESGSKVWIYERQIGDKQFSPIYCFPDQVEFLPADFLVMSHFTSTSKMVFFTYMVLAVRFILSNDGEELIGENVIVKDRGHRRVHGKKEELGPFRSEPERVEAIEKHLGIRLDDMQRTGILGLASMIG